MLATRKSNSSGPFPEKLPNPSVRFGAARAEHFPHAIDMSSGNGHVSNHLQAESLGTGFILLDACFRLICASEEALAILAYPRVPSENKGFENFIFSTFLESLVEDGLYLRKKFGLSEEQVAQVQERRRFMELFFVVFYAANSLMKISFQ